VYYFIDREGSVLYVGKATSLRSRVGSYWARPLDDRLSLMLQKIETIKIQTTDTALEALILEANEIQRLDPPVNIRGKDNKTFAQIVLTKETYPRLLNHRPTQKLTVPIDRSFGPYVSGYSARLALKALQGMFRFYCGALGRGVTPKLQEGGAKGGKGVPNSGRPCLYYQLGRCSGICVGAISPKSYRDRINKAVLFLEGKKQRIIATTKRQMATASQAQDYEEAARLRDQLFALEHIRDTAFMTEDTTEFLGSALPARLEAYDISNIGTVAAVASMVVLEHGRPNPAEYRHFRIKTVPGQNDVAMVREVMGRRAARADWPDPDFVLIDGGMAQRTSAERAFKLAGRTSIPIAGVVKGPDRQLARLMPNDAARKWLNDHRLTTQQFEPIVRLARDEAQRFAIKYHRKLRSKRA
jgi:excinuclease ABC subunit C